MNISPILLSSKKKKKRKFILKDSGFEKQLFLNRIVIAWIFTVIAISVLIVRGFYLQVIDHDKYTTLSENNRLKILPIVPTRGSIYDRNGVLLASNEISYTFEMIPEQSEDIDKTLAELGELMTITEEDIAAFKKNMKRKRRFDPVPLRHHLTEDEVFRYSAKRHRFPGTNIISSYSRYYPLGHIGSHAIGYVGRINERELKRIDPDKYRGSKYIGKVGVEKSYEEILHGQVGIQKVETNVQGRILRVLERRPPVAGSDLYLNIDITLQNFAEQVIKRERAAIVAIEPATGAVLALASMPNYDLNLFSSGIDVKSYRKLRDAPDRPLYNRAIHGQYPPGSTIKAFVGLAGLEYGVRTEHSRTWCPGFYRIKNHRHKYRCWNRRGHGSMNLHHALEQSCDVYFYDLAYDLGIDRLHAFMSRFGFGQKTGIDLKGEFSGLMPSREWKRRVRKKAWYPGETLIAGIGQGFMLSTPLQLAFATATLSMRGKVKTPRLVFALDHESSNIMQIASPPPQADVTLKKERFWDVAINGMVAVVHGRRGTARKVSKGSKYRFAGKTGTAQVFSIKQNERYDARRLAKHLHDHALFVSFAPLHNPRIAVAVIVENGGSGSKKAAPLAKKVMDYYLVPKKRASLMKSIR